mmetsp:Transcript_840/g.1786  ORF Transcript_840/g.1786 Transcript_840/m.1786 type:complete len:785 (-) Transcript_840:73-2427(-)|eukprot:CAMPEP_0172383364 /NCGR_PEP_ID=MMETSP1061-20121228/1260_1 /TAXON_ID=37318 /ORGANISM="Pseudo-nitzschia pungens, Strain cf. pungens" /LENGTH=784 /DNA_ID=CAMNT_0013111591 /DNA_START=42 /DNA_END=2396 /DNA_ORIENTATION=-
MSWLTNVNSLLTKLDGQAETMAVMVAEQDGLSDEIGIDKILAKRGLSSVNVEDGDDHEKDYQSREDERKEGAGDMEQGAVGSDVDKEITLDIDSAPQLLIKPLVEHKSPKTAEEVKTAGPVIETTNDAAKRDSMKGDEKRTALSEKDDDTNGNSEVASFREEAFAISKDGDVRVTDESKVLTHESSGQDNEERTSFSLEDPSLPNSGDGARPSPPSPDQTPSLTRTVIQEDSASTLGQKQKQQLSILPSPNRSKREVAQAQKEARILRRHVVSLNEQLEIAESELQAQRKELERAAERMEKDRVRQKEEKALSQKQSSQEIEVLKSQHERSLKEQQTRFEEQLERYRKKLSEEEKRRKQQGGDWDKEMSNAIDREQEMRKTINALEDEKAIFLSQISTLQGQQAVLGSRLESLTEAADNAMERERDAENRLDVALNQHARQISQRQARESELERTVQELNAALVVSSQVKIDCDAPRSAGTNNSHLQARISALEIDLQAANSQLAMEREQSDTLQSQLRSFTSETTQEASMVHAKELQYDRKIADMSLTIAKLEAKVRVFENLPQKTSNQSTTSLSDEDMPSRIKVLSEEVVRLRDKVANYNSESLALKNRLKVAVDRSNKFEEELMIAKTLSNGNGDFYDSIERGGGKGLTGRRRRHGAPSSGSIRTAMLLNSSRGDRTEKIGEVVDQIDSFAASTAKYLRRNPLARAGFIFYLILIHLWTFVLLSFHAHSFDTITNDISAGHFSHGPHALIQQHERMKNTELSINADASAAVPNPVGKKENP